MTLVRRYATRLAVLSLGVGALAAVQPAVPAVAADAVAGAQTAGDSLFPNQGNGGYDAKHYDIDFRVDIGISSTSGGASTTNLPRATATIDAVTTGAPLSSYSFDFQGTTTTLANATLNVDSVTVNGAPATFTRIENTTVSSAVTDNHKLVVTPSVPVDGAFTTVVNYSGRPVIHTDTDGSLEGWNNTVDGASFVNQPIGAMTLFPHNNTPRDTATYKFTVDAPTTVGTSNLAQAGGKPYPVGVASNGELTSRTTSGDGTRTTWVWEQRKPMASELSLISVGRFDIYTSDITLASGRTIPEWTFIDPASSIANQTQTLGTRAQLKQMLDFFETKYGPYPGNSTGLVTDNTTGIGYALETQDRPYSPNTATRGTTYHEIMHQWWGDNVTPTDWNDITLNEGPATYSEYQLPDELIGTAANTTTEQSLYGFWASTGLTGTAGQTWAVAPAAMTTASQLFGAPTYNKGGMALEALRTSIGAADYETLMRQYQLQYGGRQTTERRTTAFENLAESISGRDLTAFFKTWFYTSGKPAWPVKFNLDVAGPTTQVDPGDQATYTVSARNTGKVAMPAGGTVVTVDLADVLDDAAIGTLPADTTLDGTTLTWTVPATALAATASIAIPVTVNAAATGTLKPVARAVTLGSTCLDCAPGVTVGAAPISPAPVPTISGGTPTVGTELTAVPGTWADGTTLAYQWFLDGTPVPGATRATYTPDFNVLGLAVTVEVTGTKAGSNSVSQTSAATPVGVRGTPISATPTISGTPRIGSKLTVNPGTWQPGTVFTYSWRANGTAISGATGPVYTPAVASQVGQTIDVVVTGTRAGYTTTAKTSAATTAVGAGDPLVSTPTPTLPATAKVGGVLTVAPGYWDDGVTLTYTWQLDGTNIASATAATYTPLAAQVGKALTVTVTGTKPGVPAVSRVSAPVTVENGTQTLQPTPTITGTPRAEVAVTGVQGTWDTGTTKSGKWYVDGVEIAGATGTTYTPTIAQIGQVLTYEVTSTRPGYVTVTKTSAGRTILGQAQVLTPTPTVTGAPKVATELTGDPGAWDDGTTLTYQWLADGTAIDGATALRFTPTAAQLGKAITFAVTSARATYETVTRTSDPTAVVGSGDLTNTPVPTIAGTPKVGVELTGVPGTWDSGTTLTYQWLVDGTSVDGATGLTYTPGPGRVGAVVTFSVTGAKDGYTSVTRTSDATAAVAPGDLASTPVPTIAGTPQVGIELTAGPGDWDSGTALTYQWSVDGKPVDGATARTFVPRAGDYGAVVTVAVTGTKDGYASTTRTSAPTAVVAPGDQTRTPVPTITGTPTVGRSLTGVPGDWDAGTTLTYQWLADGAPVDGADSLTFTPGPGRLGAVITFAVTSTKDGYSTITRTSAPTAAVGAGDQDSTPVPTITGTPKVGVELTGVPGDWDEGTTLTYQWSADGADISGATSSTFTPGPAQLGAVITFAVTSTKDGYTTITRTSAPTAAVGAGDQTSTPTPTITGTPKVGVPLTGVPGDWDAGTTLTYQWLADGSDISGATSLTFTPGPAQVGAVVTFAVTSTKDGYSTTTRTSAPTAAVGAGGQGSTPVPMITGTPKVGALLTGVPGDWDAGTTLTYQWLVDGAPVDGANSPTFTPAAGQLGAVVTFAVTSTKGGYATVTRTSAPTAAVGAGDQTSTPTPTIAGKARVGATLRARTGSWDQGTTLRYRWTRNGAAIAGAAGATYLLGAKDLNAAIAVVVTSTKPGYATVTRTSARTVKVARGIQTRTPAPVIRGTARVGSTLTAYAGTHDAGTVVRFTWYTNGRQIAGATARTYAPTRSRVGTRITVVTTTTKTAYVTVKRTSAATKAVTR
jgi:uncharacterized repeat protein (TIGR01451 family)